MRNPGNGDEVERLKIYLHSNQVRLKAVTTILEHLPKIINQTVNKSNLLVKISSCKSTGTNRYIASCCRDLQYFLRCATYALLAANTSILDELVLNGLLETYQALGISIEDTVKAIQAMKEVVAEFIEAEVGQEMAEYFDYICSGLMQPSVSTQPTEQGEENTSLETCESWEPKNYEEWLEKDKLAQQMKENGVEDQDAFRSSAIGFFEGWSRMPSELKRKVWREREVMAELYKKMNSWEKIPGFISIGVAQRVVNGEEQIAGIVNFKPSSLPSEQYYQKFDIPTFLNIKSSIDLTESGQQELVPILIEWMEPPVKYNSSKFVIANSEIQSSKITKETSSVLTLQSGDVLIGRNGEGRFSEDGAVTLTTFVSSLNTKNSLNIQVLSVSHGFKAGYEVAYTGETNPYGKIGGTYYTSLRQKEIADKLDVALFNIENQLSSPNSNLKWVDHVPEKPIPVYTRMPVQMYGGVSKYQTGYIDQSITIFPGSASSTVPYFTAKIPSQPGDSGALLVSGENSENQSQYMNEKYLDIKNSMLGMLIEGQRTNYDSFVIFRPMTDILYQLKINPWLLK